jgi:hypothetical protein
MDGQMLVDGWKTGVAVPGGFDSTKLCIPVLIDTTAGSGSTSDPVYKLIPISQYDRH